MSVVFMLKRLDVVNWIFKLFFGWPKNRHLINHLKIFIYVFCLHQGVLDGLVEKLLLLFEWSFDSKRIDALTFIWCLFFICMWLNLVNLLKSDGRLYLSTGRLSSCLGLIVLSRISNFLSLLILSFLWSFLIARGIWVFVCDLDRLLALIYFDLCYRKIMN